MFQNPIIIFEDFCAIGFGTQSRLKKEILRAGSAIIITWLAITKYWAEKRVVYVQSIGTIAR